MLSQKIVMLYYIQNFAKRLYFSWYSRICDLHLKLNINKLKNIKEGMHVKYIGETNDFTFKNDLSTNSIGVVKKVIEVGSKLNYQVEFENGIIASIDSDELANFDS